MSSPGPPDPLLPVFGPVPSRRLGRSLGVNAIPPKWCSYACVYCQLGRTPHLTVARRAFTAPAEVADAVSRRLEECAERGVAVDWVTVVPDGEPTLDLGLGELLARLADLGPPLAVITNGSLLDRADVRAELSGADWVSVKLDAVDEPTWRAIDRPHGRLRMEAVLEGVREFAAGFGGTLVTETMLVKGVNDHDAAVEAVARELGRLRPAVAYLAVPTRPPAEGWVRPPRIETVLGAFATVAAHHPRPELLVGEPGDGFDAAGEPERELLAVAAVHPLDERAVVELAGGREDALAVAERLVRDGLLVTAELSGRRFYLRAARTAAGRDR